MQDRLKVAVVGAGIRHSPDGREGWAVRAHLPALEALPGLFEPIAVCTTRLESARDYAVCRMELWNVNPTFTGLMAYVTVLAGMLPLDTSAQRSAALSRFEQMEEFIDTEIAKLREGVELGYSAPRVSVEATIAQLDAFLALDAGDQDALEADLIALLRSYDVGGPDGLVVPGEYLETVITT